MYRHFKSYLAFLPKSIIEKSMTMLSFQYFIFLLKMGLQPKKKTGSVGATVNLGKLPAP